MANRIDSAPGSRRLLVITAAMAAIAAVAVAALLVNIFEHRQEAKNPFFRAVELNDTIDDPAIWGKDFPMQYDLYQRTVDMERTRYGGSEAEPHSPTEGDPRTVVARSKIEADPRLKEMWAGYSFSKDYREKRGHAYMLEDQTFTERQQANPPGTCLNCHASMVTTYNKLGNGDIFKGFEAVNHMPYMEARKLVTHPVACIDCHDPKTMGLRITRPAFIEGIRAYKASLGVQNYDVNRDATRQEMRSYICGQCHVTYYFHGPEKRLTFPWTKGLKLDQIVAHEDEDKVKEWVHAESGAPMMKARHPEFETWNQGIHSRSGVACADCHMPYMREGGLKISDHNVRSPLLNINRACQTCHRWPEQELKDRVEEIQTRFFDTRNIALDALMDLIHDIKAAKEQGATDAELEEARNWQRKAQFYIDFLVSENSMGFHADQYSVKSLAEAINMCRQGQLSLRRKLDVKTAASTSTGSDEGSTTDYREMRRPAALIRVSQEEGKVPQGSSQTSTAPVQSPKRKTTMSQQGRIIGIGGIFFKSANQPQMKEWYAKHLGLADSGHGAMLPWREKDNPENEQITVWSIFPGNTKYFEPSQASFMLNYIVDDLDALLDRLAKEGVRIDPKRQDEGYGRFAWIYDPDGNKIELWQPVNSKK